MSGCVQELFSEARGITYQVMLRKAAVAPCLGTGWCLILWSKRMDSHWEIRKKLFQVPGLVWPNLPQEVTEPWLAQSSEMVGVESFCVIGARESMKLEKEHDAEKGGI